MRRLRCDAGHTLVELDVAAGVFAIIGSLLAAVMVSLTGATRRGAAEVDTERLARIGLERMAEELREAPADNSAMAIWARDDAAPSMAHAFGFVSARQEAAGRPFGADQEGQPRWRTAVYYTHDFAKAEVRRIARPWDGAFTLPPDGGGYLVARSVRHLSVSRNGELVTIAMSVIAGHQEIRLETAVRPRN